MIVPPNTPPPPQKKKDTTKLILYPCGDKLWAMIFSTMIFSFQVQLTWKIVETGNNYPRREFVREVLEKPVLQLVPHLGYVSLFPFILRLIPPVSSLAVFQQYIISSCLTLDLLLYLHLTFLARYWQ